MIKGTESAKAVAIPVTKLVAPGPEVAKQTPISSDVFEIPAAA